MRQKMETKHRFTSTLKVNHSVERLFSWHENPGAYERLTPPFEPVAVKYRKGNIDGGEVHIKIPFIPLIWVAKHHSYKKNVQFMEDQASGPFVGPLPFWNGSWHHEHLFDKVDENTSVLTDDIAYDFPMDPFGSIFGGWYTTKRLKQMFAYRRHVTKNDLDAQAKYEGRPLDIAVTGGSGLVGSGLMPYLTTAGHKVENIVRGRPKKGQLCWNINKGTISSLEGKDAVVHLAGEPINKPLGGKIPIPWTEWKRKEILESRVEGTRLIAEHLASLNKKPKVLVCASAIGYYGDRGEELLSENAEKGSDYFSHVVSEWEAAAKPAIDAGIRVVFLRLAPVMSPLGGALQVLSLPAMLGSSPPVAGGKQWWSWVSIDDAIGSIYHSIITETLSGAVNVASPNPVRQKEWASTLAKVFWGRLGKLTTLIPIPGFVLKTFLGEFGDVLALSSIKADSSKLIDSGYKFRFNNLEDCFRHLLGKRLEEDL
ncbi:MAG: TIGR01777 family oxidoreductase [Candidatus Poseidoniales archaeon]